MGRGRKGNAGTVPHEESISIYVRLSMQRECAEHAVQLMLLHCLARVSPLSRTFLSLFTQSCNCNCMCFPMCFFLFLSPFATYWRALLAWPISPSHAPFREATTPITLASLVTTFYSFHSLMNCPSFSSIISKLPSVPIN